MSRKRGKPARRRVPAEIIIVLTLILGVGLAGGLWYFVVRPRMAVEQGSPGAGAPVAEASMAPDFTVMGLDGNSVRLSDYRGRPVVLNTWATWCGPCRAEMPDLERLHQEYRHQGVIVLAVNIGEPRERVAGFIQDNGFTLPVLLDETASAVARPYRISALPTTFFIDHVGQIASIKVGMMDLAEMKRRLSELLASQE